MPSGTDPQEQAWEQAIASLPTPMERAQAATRMARRAVGTPAESRAATVWMTHVRALADSAERLAIISAVSRALVAPAPYLKPAIVDVGLETLATAPSSSDRYIAASFVEWFAIDDASRERAIGFMLDDAGHTGSALVHILNIERTLKRVASSSALHERVVAIWQARVNALADPATYLRNKMRSAEWPEWPLRDAATALLAQIGASSGD